MPSSVVAAVVGSAVSSWVAAEVAATVMAPLFFSQAIGAVAGMAASSMVSGVIGGGGGGQSSAPPQTTAAGFVSQAQARGQVIRSAVSNRSTIYGRALVSGPLIFAAVQDVDSEAAYLEQNPDLVENELIPGDYADGWSHWNLVGEGEGRKWPGDLLHMVVAIAAHEIDGIETLYFNDQALTLDGSGNVTNAPFAGYARVVSHLGAAGQAADADLIAANVGWTAAHRLEGVAYLYIRLEYSQDAFPRGIPNVKAVVRGKKLYDPRSGTTAWSRNWALAVRDYLTMADGLACASGELDGASFIAAANIADESVVGATGSEARYLCDGVVDSGNTPRQILEAMLTAGAGILVWSGGVWRLHAGAYDAPAVTLTADDLRGPVRVSPRVSRQYLFNAVKGTYVDPSKYWQPSDYPGVKNATYASQDGQTIWRDFTLPMTISSGAAQRLAKLQLERGRQGITVDMPCKLTAVKLAVWDTVRVTLAQLGWSGKEFRVVSWRFAEAGGVDLVLQEEVADSYNWNSGNETVVDAAPDTQLPTPFICAPPVGLTLASGGDVLIKSGSGDIISRIKADWTLPTDSNVRRAQVQFRKVGATFWTSAPEVASARAISTAYCTGVDDGALYDVRVRYENSIGVRSVWTYPPKPHTVIGKSAPPANVQRFVIDGDTLSWVDVPDIDLAGYRIKFNYGSTSLAWNTANPLHSGLITDSPYTMSVHPSGPVVILIKAVDTSGNESLDPATIFTHLGDPLVANVIEAFDFHAAGFPGSVVAAHIEAGTHDLVATDVSGQLWSPTDVTEMWQVNPLSAMWIGTIGAAMRYDFSFTPSVGAYGSTLTLPYAIEGGAWSIQYRQQGAASMWSGDAQPMWSIFDAMWSADASAAAWINDSTWMFRTSGLMWAVPEYSSWPGQVIAAADVYDFRIDVAFGSPIGRITALVAQIDVPDRIAHYADLAIGAAGVRLPIGDNWFAVTSVGLTLQDDGGSGYTAKIIDKSPSLGPLVKIFNSSGTATSGVLDATVQGY